MYYYSSMFTSLINKYILLNNIIYNIIHILYINKYTYIKDECSKIFVDNSTRSKTSRALL